MYNLRGEKSEGSEAKVGNVQLDTVAQAPRLAFVKLGCTTT